VTILTGSERDTMELDGARVLLTGASAGIGAAAAPMLADRGAVLVLCGRDNAKLEPVAERCRRSGAQVRAHCVDLSDPGAAERLARDAELELDGIDILVNNAGAPMRRRVQQLTVEDLQRTMAVNFESPVRMTMALLPGMLVQDRGVVVNVASFGGRAAIPAEAAYCASKYALCGWSESLAMDLWHTGVEVRLIVPGAIDTDIWDRPGNDPPHFSGELEPAETVAAGIIAAIEGGGFEHYLPDMKALVEFKASSIDDYLAGAVAFADSVEASRRYSDDGEAQQR
jgi:short-subunit dehydrogenase